jgi:hypothetical protein
MHIASEVKPLGPFHCHASPPSAHSVTTPFISKLLMLH